MTLRKLGHVLVGAMEFLDPSVGAAIQSAMSESMGSLANNLTQVIESRLSDFAKQFSEENSLSIEQAVSNSIPTKGKETSSSWIILSRCWIN